MKIAVIGAGNVGGGLARAAVAAGHTVTVSASSPGKADEVAGATGALSAESNQQAVAGADLVLLAVPHSAVAAVAAEIRDAVSGVTVVDATNPLNETYSDLVIEGDSAAGDLQALIPGASVVKAFNTLFASRYGAPHEDGRALPVFIAGDDADAKAEVAQFAQSLGFQTLDVGGLRHARGLEELAFLNIALNATHGWSWQSAWTLVGPTSLD
jgi:8-hydroxy-5-deazaflavin:NADPH oxidoreductase